MASFVTKIRTTPAQPLTVTLSDPGFAVGFGSLLFGSGSVQTNDIRAIAAGGVGPYTYNWTYVSGATGFNPTASTSATCAWFKIINLDTTEIATWRCTVTDSLSNTATVDVTVQLTIFPIYGFTFL